MLTLHLKPQLLLPRPSHLYCNTRSHPAVQTSIASCLPCRRQLGTILETVNPRKSKGKKKQSKHRKQGNASSYKFVDTTRIKVAGGLGGKGCLSYVSMYGSTYKRRPDGGHGGHGGRVIIMADANEQSLNMSTHHYKAQDGTNGSSKEMRGRNGKDKIIRVPCGVVVKR